MDEVQLTRNHVSYIFSKEVILKDLLKQGTITEADFERYDQMLYDRYHLDMRIGLPRPIITKSPSDEPIISGKNGGVSYISLTSIAKDAQKGEPGYLVQSWLRDRNTIELLRCWELQHNSEFNLQGYDELAAVMDNPAVTMTAKKWIDSTGATGLVSKPGRGGGTYAHPEIACAFQAWLYPDFQYAMIQSYLSSHDTWRISK